MSDHKVEYELTLKDLLTGKIQNADHAAQALEGSLHHAGESARSLTAELVGAFGIGLSAFKGIEFVKEGLHHMHELEQVTAKVEANLEATKGIAGLSMEELGGFAKSLTNKIQYSRAEITDMQSQLLTFPAISKDVFERSMGMVADIAKQTNHGLSETAIMFGKAFSSPEDGLKKMMRYGVMFTDAQQEMITKLQESGHLVKAQQYMLNAIAESGYEGVARSMANADPLFRYHKIMDEIQLKVGELAMKLLKHLVPAIEWVANATKSTLHWMREHKDLLYAVGAAVGTMVAGWLIYEVVTKAVTVATSIWTGVQWLLNAAMTANPIGIIIVGIGLLVGAMVYCYNKFDWFRGIVHAVWASLTGLYHFVKDTLIAVFAGLGQMLHGAFTLNLTEIKAGWKFAIDGAAKAGLEYGKNIMDGYNEGVASKAGNPLEKAIGPKNIAKGKVLKGDTGDAGKSESAKATGAKNISIHITIGNLIKDFQIKTTNLSEGVSKAKELVTQALLSAVNDSQIVAGH